jgi:hypothetical protein
MRRFFEVCGVDEQTRELLIEEPRDVLRFVQPVPNALRDHQAVDAIGCEIFHVAVE